MLMLYIMVYNGIIVLFYFNTSLTFVCFAINLYVCMFVVVFIHSFIHSFIRSLVSLHGMNVCLLFTVRLVCME